MDFSIVDSHVHLCDPSRLGYSWMNSAPQLRRVVLPEHLTEAAAPVRIDQFVFVEVDVDEGQHLEEAAWVTEQAGRDPRLAAMVAALPLEQGTAIERDLDRLCRLNRYEPSDASSKLNQTLTSVSGPTSSQKIGASSFATTPSHSIASAVERGFTKPAKSVSPPATRLL
jgi:hypothetical protein